MHPAVEPFMTMLRDPDMVDVATELGYWRSRAQPDASAVQDFRRYGEPVIRMACEIYTRHPHASRVEWEEELDRRLQQEDAFVDAGYSRQLAQQCWDRLLGVG
jgi:hypothetical protein